MDWSGWAIFGLLATAALTIVMTAGQLLGWTRADLPLMLGTMLVPDPDHARIAGFAVHVVNGQVFALGYAVAFAQLGRATWWLGLILGGLHAGVALAVIIPLLPGVHPRMASERAGLGQRAGLEPPGLFALNYGLSTPAVLLFAHLVYGVALGLLIDPA